MPKPSAIRLTSKNMDLIESTLGIPRKEIEKEYMSQPGTVYYVKDAYLFNVQVPYLIYGRRSFLEEFASVPPGIEDGFVPVTQVRG